MAQAKSALEADWNRMYIDGEWRQASGGDTVAVENPSTREAFAEAPAATVADVDAAYEAAEAAQPEWAARSREERNEILEAAMEELNARYEEVADVMAHEAGAPGWRIMNEFTMSVEDLSEAVDLEVPDEEVRDSVYFDGKKNHVVREPVGVVGVISPWNFPLHISMRAVAPALALGNTVVLKPSIQTPISGGLLLAEVFEEAGVPDGVLNVVSGRGSEIGDRVAGHPIPRVISFTGSSEIGRRVGKHAAESLALPGLELGGNGPQIVTEDVDVELAARAGAFGTFIHQGQACASINRHLVHEDVYDDYVAELVDHAETLVIGNPCVDDSVTFGPVQNETQRDDLVRFIEESVARGAEIETGGGIVDPVGVDDSLFVEPTVLSNCTNDMPASCNEHFGPIAPVIPFGDDEEAIEIANDTEYGLTGSVFCEDLDRAKALANRIDAGGVHVNDQPINEEQFAPFGGMGASGLGRHHGEWIVDEFTETKWLSVQHDERDYQLFSDD